MTTKKSSLTQLKAILRESAFDPRKPGPFKVITDVGNVDYYINRAIELCYEAQTSNKPDAILMKAISLLALARVTGKDKCGPAKDKKKERTRSNNSGSNNTNANPERMVRQRNTRQHVPTGIPRPVRDTQPISPTLDRSEEPSILPIHGGTT